jgi:hypothetical protein
MARVSLEIQECSGDLLPPVCCVCGENSTRVSKQTFTHLPRWVYLSLFFCVLPFFFLSVALTKRRFVVLPTCDRHAYPGIWRKCFSILGTVLIIFCIIWWGIVSARSNSYAPPSFWDQIDEGVQIGGGVVGAILLVVSSFVGVRATKITNSTITLTGVAPAFAEATEQYRILLEEFGDRSTGRDVT